MTKGTDTVFGIEPDQHLMASYYRNTIIHHFVNKAILEMALLSASDAPDGENEAAFWAETLRLRNFFKFEFFYPTKKKFMKQLRTELESSDPRLAGATASGRPGNTAHVERHAAAAGHATLLPFVEAYSVVFDLLARLPDEGGLEEVIA